MMLFIEWFDEVHCCQRSDGIGPYFDTNAPLELRGISSNASMNAVKPPRCVVVSHHHWQWHAANPAHALAVLQYYSH